MGTTDFAARLKWATLPPEQAKHPPEIDVTGGLKYSAAVGQPVRFEVHTHAKTTWKFWIERGEAELTLADERPQSTDLRNLVLTPKSASEVHAIIAVTLFPLTRYARVVVNVTPKRG